MRTRIVAYRPFGASLPALPDPLQVQVVTPLGELSTAEVQYPRQGVGAAGLDGAVELGFEYLKGGAWVEPPNCRFLSMRGSFDHLESTPTRKYSFVSVGWMLRGARVWAASGLPVDADGKVQFLSASAGKIMSTLIANAKARGWGAGLTVDFTATADSSGKAWAKVITIAYDLDIDLDAILSNLYQQGVCDFRWEGRTLRIFNPDTSMGRDLTLGANPTRLVVADGQTAAPEDWTNEDLLTDAMVIGDKGWRWNFANAGARPFGRLEKLITQGGVTDPGTAALLADQDLVRGSATRVSYTREFAVTDAMAKAPFRDYLPGDWVQTQRGTGFERLRTQSLSVTVTGAEVKGHAVLGDRLEDLLTKLAKRTKGISGGASVGGSGVRPAPEGPDKRVPVAPTGLTVLPSSYIDGAGNAQGQIHVGWAHSGRATDGSVMSIDRYQVQYRVNDQNAIWQVLAQSSDKSVTWSPMPLYKADGVTPQQYGFRVRAFGANGLGSAVSATTAVLMELDTTPPPVPYFKASDVSTWLRTVTVKWGRKGTTTGTDQVPMPRDFDHVNVYRAASANMVGAVLVGMIRDVSSWTSEGEQPTVTVFYALSSVDRAGNESVKTAGHPVTPAANVDISKITAEIDAANVTITNAREILLASGAQLGEKLDANDAAQEQLDKDMTALEGRVTPVEDALEGVVLDLDKVQESVNGKNKTVRETTDASGTAGFVAGDTWEKWSTLATGGKLLQSWRFTGAAWVTEAMDATYLPRIDIGQGTFGELSGGRLLAGSVTARSLVVGDFDNHASTAADADTWDYASASADVGNVSYAASASGRAIRFRGGAGITSVYATKFTVNPGDSIYVSGVFRSDGGAAEVGRLTLGLRYLNADGSTNAWDIYATFTDEVLGHASRKTITGVSKVPEGAAYATPLASVRGATGTANPSKYAYLIGPTIRRMNAGELIVDGAVRAKQINAESVAGAVGQFIELDVSQLNASSANIDQAVIDKLWVDVVNARKITANMMVIGDSTNVYPDPRFSLGLDWLLAPTGWEHNPAWGNRLGAIRYVNSSAGSVYMPYLPDRGIPVIPGDQYLVTAEVAVTGGTTPNVHLRVYCYDADNVNTNVMAGAALTNANGAYKTVGGLITIPAGTKTMAPRVTFYDTVGSGENLYVTNVKVARAAAGELIVDGAITTDKLTANAVTAAKIASLAITTAKLAANAVTADKANIGSLRAGILTANSVTTNTLAAGSLTTKHTITGSKYQSTSAANQGVTITGPSGGKASVLAQAIASVNGKSVYQTLELSTSAKTISYGGAGGGKPVTITLPGLLFSSSDRTYSRYPSLSADPSQPAVLLQSGFLPGNANDGSTLTLFSQGNWSIGGLIGGSGLTKASIGGNTSTGFTIQGNMRAFGTKNFIMPHPTKDGLDLLHGSTESPVSGIEYWGDGITSEDSEVTITLPDYFEALRDGKPATVLVTGRGETLDWTDITDGQFQVTAPPGTVFSWLVKSERAGYEFDTEQPSFNEQETTS